MSVARIQKGLGPRRPHARNSANLLPFKRVMYNVSPFIWWRLTQFKVFNTLYPLIMSRPSRIVNIWVRIRWTTPSRFPQSSWNCSPRLPCFLRCKAQMYSFPVLSLLEKNRKTHFGLQAGANISRRTYTQRYHAKVPDFTKEWSASQGPSELPPI